MTLIRLLALPFRFLVPGDARLELPNEQWQLGLTVRAQASEVG